jgi:hypothetical protein
MKLASYYEMLLPVHKTPPCHITQDVSLHQHQGTNFKYHMKEFINALCEQNEAHI